MEIKDNMQPRLERWENRLRSITTQSLTTDYVRPTEETRIVEAIHNVALPEATRTALLQLAILDGSHSVSPFTVLLAAFAVLAARLTGDEDISIGTSGETKEPFVLRLPIDPKTSFADLLERVKNLESEGTADAVPLLELIQYLQNKSKAPKPPRLFNLSLYYAPDAPSQQFLASHELQTDLSIYVELNSPPQVTNSLRFVPQIPEITLSAHYNQFIFSSKRISNMIDQLMQIVQIGAADPKIEIGSIPLMTEQQKAILPDPTRDLHWSEFRGPIHDIFSANAKKHPERECVVETADPHNPEGKKRVFTYQQIDEASNQLAHHFVAKGVKRGDVVMVYAYRGVDLVVSVMGVLKAGATFSVIDPAYPPARQNIYLQVAQPRALVVIEKAGKLSNTVRDYLNELHILTEVPALAIQADGNLLGGEIDGKDVLAEQVALKAEGTGVVVGPDSNPTLSFTSGSEGIPKGVRGRHFSLTYYFPWMAETFGLSENDRFTMLSGIAHDPIQRDIFTPLFLGAKLLVPTADDIGTPGRLAEWMDENGATITHLTPAMGQLLSAQAEHPIPSLHHAFFVGDILTKRDCLRLQGLARNCAVVNMYGTTETQRAVSYFEVPSLNADPTFSQSQKDVIAAGKGMLDVQLLVVNRHNRQQVCGVGEIGEIYVRAGGLAEGYLRLPDMTATKFINNWFVTEDHWKAKDVDNGEAWREFFMGPRDRMYRTGDLGRYTPDGNVECSGRADDQVKIRGFRIELGEIDTHLSQHPLVRENVTLVRRDKDEEPVLISYVVPLQSGDLDDLVSADEGSKNEDGQDDEIVKGLRRYRRLITEIKSYLKKRLPSYAVPTVVVPLAKLPLNPNGKVDKPALPFPDTAQLAAANRGRRRTGVNEEGLQLSPVQKQLKEVWQELLPHAAGSVSLTDNFFDLGGHSILATRMIFEIRKRFITDIALGAIFKHPTLAGLAQEIERIRTGGAHEMGIHNIANPELAIEEETPVEDYAGDARELAKALPASFLPSHDVVVSGGITVFLTGATGFLGAYLIRDLLRRADPQVKKIIAHVRASDAAKGLERVKSSCNAYGVWDESWASRIEVATGSLGDDKLGMNDADYKKVVEEVDVIIHNGAQVHWVYPYSKLKGANVKGTIDALALCTEGKPKSFAFVSSTSVLDTDHYVKLSDTILEAGGAGVPESDDLEGSATGLGTGYGQSKWVGEFLVREAGKRGLDGCIIRPGYITGDSETGVTNTDDFLMRMVKGCAQLGKMPDIVNTVNMVPVDHVARVVVACAVSPPVTPLAVAQVTGHPRLRMNEFLATLATYGYDVQTVDYIPWRMALENYVMGESKDNALFPLLHFVLDDLPSGTKAPELADGNAVTALLEDAKWTKEDWSKGAGVSVEIMGVYIAYLIAIGFLPEPQGKGERELPKIQLTEEAKKSLASVGGRGGAA